MTPEGWRKATYGHAMTETEQRAEGAIDLPVLSVTKTRGPMLASERFGKVMHGRDLGKYRVAHRDYVVADPMLLWDGSIGLQTVVDAGLVSPDYRVYKPAPEIDPKFLGYLVRSPLMLRHYQGGARGTNVRRNRIARSDFLAIPVGLPPLGEQRKIAAILSSVDQALDAKQAIIDQLQVVKRAMMAELLTRGVPGRHTRFSHTEIGEVPEDWQVVQLERVLSDGPSNGIYKPAHLIGRGSLIAGMTAIDGSTLRWEACRRAELEGTEAERFGLQERDILVTRVYARIDGIGRFIVVPKPPETSVYESNMMRIRIDCGTAIPEFVALHMGLDDIRREIEQRATLGAQASINNAGVRTLPLRLPPMGEQEEIVRAIGVVTARTEAEAASLQQLKAAKTALMSVLLTGEVRVKPEGEVA